ncbi:MAG: transporter substrate-binding domain-containing protein [Clostridia bacterium]|nr:transporter substrate-binding domain-containing protein [Clostridia bacterium]
MKHIKKILALMLAVLFVLTAFAGCGGKTATDPANPGEDQPADTQKLVMATNASFPPYEFKGDSGEIEGIDAEIAAEIAKKIGRELEIVDTEFGSIIGGVQSGKYDIGMAGMTVTEERKQSVNFTTSYATAVQAVIVPEDSEYTSYEDFYTGMTVNEDGDEVPAGVKDGIKIGVQQDTTGDIYCSDLPEKWGFDEKNVVRFKTGNDAVQALVSGKVTAVIIDNEPAKSYVAANSGLKILDGAYTEEEYAICVAKENTDLLNQINSALEELIADGTVDAIVAKYIPA